MCAKSRSASQKILGRILAYRISRIGLVGVIYLANTHALDRGCTAENRTRLLATMADEEAAGEATPLIDETKPAEEPTAAEPAAGEGEGEAKEEKDVEAPVDKMTPALPPADIVLVVKADATRKKQPMHEFLVEKMAKATRTLQVGLYHSPPPLAHVFPRITAPPLLPSSTHHHT